MIMYVELIEPTVREVETGRSSECFVRSLNEALKRGGSVSIVAVDLANREALVLFDGEQPTEEKEESDPIKQGTDDHRSRPKSNEREPWQRPVDEYPA